jgi:putative pyruvate formate lyase activating enzyme
MQNNAGKKLLENCRICPRRCGVDRLSGQTGYCGLDGSAYFYRELLNPFEEKILSPSHQLYAAGCNMRCCYCSVGEWNVEPMSAGILSEREIIESIDIRRRQGALNLNLLGGEPAVSIAGIIELLGKIKTMPKIVWNSNMYYLPVIWPLLEDFVDIYLADFKCYAPQCCENILDAGDYCCYAKSNILRASETADVIIRHVALPGHFDCCTRPILDWVRRRLPGVKLSLWYSYVPQAQSAGCPGGYLSRQEKQSITEYSDKLELNYTLM